jgi:hypothetical protein
LNNLYFGGEDVYKIGSAESDPVVVNALDKCGGKCTVGFMDGMKIQVYSPIP